MKAKLIAKEELTPDTKKFVFSTAEELDFRPGQFIMLEVRLRNECEFKILDGKAPVQKRAFSISSSPTLSKNRFELAIKHEKGGFVSEFLTNITKIGEEFEITGPFGKFVFNDEIKHAVLIAAGSGIAPIRSMLNYVVDKELPTKIDMFYSNRTPEDIAFFDELKEIKQQNVRIYFTITRPNESRTKWAGNVGRINYGIISKDCNTSDATFFICGPTAMVKELREEIIKNGINEERVKIEAW